MSDQQRGHATNPMVGQADVVDMLSGVPGKMRAVLLSPAAFYREMPRTGGFVEPLVFAVVTGTLAAVVMVVMGMLGLGAGSMLPLGFMAMILAPFLVAIGSFIGAGVIFVIWKLMGSSENYETAYRCVTSAYACAPVAALVAGIPYLGSLVQIAWPMALLAVASIEVHGREPRLAWGVFGALALLGAFSSLSAEYTARHLGDSLEGWSQRMEEKYGNPDDMTPEQAGKAVGEFLKGLQQMQQQGK